MSAPEYPDFALEFADDDRPEARLILYGITTPWMNEAEARALYGCLIRLRNRCAHRGRVLAELRDASEKLAYKASVAGGES